jgi:hypothetical protein
MNEYTTTATVANGVLCSALIDVLLDKGVITRDDALKIVSIARDNAAPFMQEPFAVRLTNYLSDVGNAIAKRS